MRDTIALAPPRPARGAKPFSKSGRCGMTRVISTFRVRQDLRLHLGERVYCCRAQANREARDGSLKRTRLLVVEDQAIIAENLAEGLADFGIEVIGPVYGVPEALWILQRRSPEIEGALLDIYLGPVNVFPVADELLKLGIRFIFMTGSIDVEIPQRFVHVPRCQKPFAITDLLKLTIAELRLW